MKAVFQIPQLPATDEDGLLIHATDWSEDVAREMARQSGIQELSPEHWRVIYALRDYFVKFGVAPAMSSVCRSHGIDGHCVHDLFSTCLNAWRIAGLPNPGEEAKSYLSDM